MIEKITPEHILDLDGLPTTNTPVTSTRMVLCKKCTERLLGRKLTKSDYAVPEEFEK